MHQPNDIVADRYEILTLLSEGSMGTTYKARSLNDDRFVSIKAVSLQESADWKILELLEREARVLATLRYPSIPNYLDYFQIDTQTDCQFYLVREFVEGEALSHLVDRGWQPNESEVKSIALQVLDILQYLHQLVPPVVHRDIKPANLIRQDNGTIALVDFGSVRDRDRPVTDSSTFVGTLGYMAPEQVRGKATPQSDLYSLGTTLLFLLTRRSPHEFPQTRLKLQFRDRLQTSEFFAHWLEKLLEPAIEDRFSSASEAARSLREERLRGSLQPSRPLPPNSTIVMTLSDDRVIVTIPPTRTRRIEAILALGFGCLMSSLLFKPIWLKLAEIAALFSPLAGDRTARGRIDIYSPRWDRGFDNHRDRSSLFSSLLEVVGLASGEQTGTYRRDRSH